MKLALITLFALAATAALCWHLPELRVPVALAGVGLLCLVLVWFDGGGAGPQPPTRPE